MSIAEVLRNIVGFLGSAPALIAMSIVAVLGISLAPLDRYVFRRKRLEYQVEYNSKIGFDTFFQQGDEDEGTPLDLTRPVGRLAHELERLSQVIIQISNTGAADIEKSDIEQPISITFNNRVIWNARVSDASTDELRAQIRKDLEFSTHSGPLTATEVSALVDKPSEFGFRDLRVVRRYLLNRFEKALTQTPGEKKSAEPEPQWHVVRLPSLNLPRKQRFKLVVVLREADDRSTAISKHYHLAGGRTKRNTIISERRQRRFPWRLTTNVIGWAMACVLLGTVAAQVGLSHPAWAGPGVPCVTGKLTLAGSTAFGPIVQTIGEGYMSACPGSDVYVASTGSLDGVHDLHGGTAQAALSDGRSTSTDAGGLDAQPLVVLVYALLVNKDVGVSHLTVDQVRRIYSGEYTNWSQLGGADVPITIVAREGGSGTRQTFEEYVLGANGKAVSEGEQSSDDCKSRFVVDTPTLLCELPTTEDVVHTVARTPGTIGYADIANQDTQNVVNSGDAVTVALANSSSPGAGSDYLSPNQGAPAQGYPFWTVEYLYTQPGASDSVSPTLIDAFTDYLNSDSAQKILTNGKYTLCKGNDGTLITLCTQR